VKVTDGLALGLVDRVGRIVKESWLALRRTGWTSRCDMFCNQPLQGIGAHSSTV
jgi:hypothetical protein